MELLILQYGSIRTHCLWQRNKRHWVEIQSGRIELMVPEVPLLPVCLVEASRIERDGSWPETPSDPAEMERI